MSKQELTEVEELRRENQKLRNIAESHKIARDYALRTAEQLREELNYKVRCRVLEQLCRDLHRGLVYALICAGVPLEGNGIYQSMKQRMDELGLLEDEK